MASNYGRISAVTIAVLALCALAAGALAQPAPGREITHAVVLPVIDRTGGGASPAILEKATAALALALEDSGEFTVASTSDLWRELTALDLRPPLNRQEQLRVCERLHADRVISGYLETIKVDPNAGAGICRIEIESLDVVAEDVIAGGVGLGELKPVPVWKGDATAITNQVLRNAAEAAVREMQIHKVRRGFVESIDDLGMVHLNLGMADGLRAGDRLVVMRGIWERELEKTSLRKIGSLTVRSLDSDRCTAVPAGGMPARTGDRVYVLYQPAEVVQSVDRGKKITSSARILVAIATLAGVVAMAAGGNPSQVQGNKSAPGGLASPEAVPWTNPGIQIEVFQNGQPPDPARQVKGYIFYRGLSQWVDVSNPDNIIEVNDVSFPTPWTDDQTAAAGIQFTKDWQYIGRTGTEESATADITYNHRPLVPGNTYFYRIRRIVNPYEPQIPISNQQAGRGRVGAAQITYNPATQTYTPDADSVLSEPSVPLGPVTFILPAIPREPANGLVTVNPQQITFNWDLGTGPTEGNGAAARYIVVAWRADNLSNPVFTSSAQRPASTTMSLIVNDPNGNHFQGGVNYVWAVGYYVEGEQRAQNTYQGLVFSQQFYFTTVNLPPGGLSVRAAGSKSGSIRRGWWGEPRAPRRP